MLKHMQRKMNERNHFIFVTRCTIYSLSVLSVPLVGQPTTVATQCKLPVQLDYVTLHASQYHGQCWSITKKHWLSFRNSMFLSKEDMQLFVVARDFKLFWHDNKVFELHSSSEISITSILSKYVCLTLLCESSVYLCDTDIDVYYVCLTTTGYED